MGFVVIVLQYFYEYAFLVLQPDGREGLGWIKSVVDGQTSWTYDKDVHSLQDAKDKKYTGVQEYNDALTITGSPISRICNP